MSKRILIINGNPARLRESFSAALVAAYRHGAEAAGHIVRVLNLAQMTFDPILHEGYYGQQPAEPDIEDAQAQILWAEHIVFVYPMWQFNIPALLKGFCERAFTPDFAYRVNATTPMEAGLLKGRSARIIQTMGMPGPMYGMLFGAHGGRAFKSMLGFGGLAPVRCAFLGMIEAGDETRQRHLKRVRALGRAAT